MPRYADNPTIYYIKYYTICDLYSVVHFNFDLPKFSESEILRHNSEEQQIRERQFGQGR